MDTGCGVLLDGAESRLLSWPNRVEGEDHFVGETLEEPDLVLGQGGAGGRDRVGDPELVGDDDVELPLDEDGEALVPIPSLARSRAKRTRPFE